MHLLSHKVDRLDESTRLFKANRCYRIGIAAIAGRGTSASAAVWPDDAADMGAADAIGLALRLRLQNLEPKEERRRSV
jgi:hypothetical protein